MNHPTHILMEQWNDDEATPCLRDGYEGTITGTLQYVQGEMLDVIRERQELLETRKRNAPDRKDEHIFLYIAELRRLVLGFTHLAVVPSPQEPEAAPTPGGQ